MENSESNHTIATDLLLTPSTSSQHGLLSHESSGAKRRIQSDLGQEEMGIPEAEDQPEDEMDPAAHSNPSIASSNQINPVINSSPRREAHAVPRRKSTLRNLHRVVEQSEEEPLCVIIFKWTLIVVGALMLGLVMFIMGEVIHAWITGTMEELNNRYRTTSLSTFDGISNDTRVGESGNYSLSEETL